MTIKEELKNRYREKKLSVIESFALQYRDQSIELRKDFIMALYYLQFTRRFRENPAYKKESFEAYVNDIFHLRIGTFNQERWAFIKHESSSIKHGPGLITKIKKVCGSLNVKKVIDKIEDAESKRKTPLPRNKKEAIILNHALPVKDKPYKEPKGVVEAKLQKAEKTIQENGKIKIEKDDQIVKLKATVRALKVENAKLKAEVEKFKAKEREFVNILSPLSDFMEREEVEVAVV